MRCSLKRERERKQYKCRPLELPSHPLPNYSIVGHNTISVPCNSISNQSCIQTITLEQPQQTVLLWMTIICRLMLRDRYLEKLKR